MEYSVPSAEKCTTTGIDFVATQHHDTYPAISPSRADLSGKMVVVTGASKGIGRATALSFARAGARGIVLLARSNLASLEDELVRAAEEAHRPAPPQVLSLAVDITDRAAVEKAAATVKATFGAVDILINNAGYLERFASIADSDPDDWWRTWEVNVKGVYLVTRSFLPLLLESTLKTVVAVVSIGAHVTTPGISAYQATKTAVLRLNACLMGEYGDKGLIAFGIHPGGVLTELASNAPKEVVDTLSDEPELAGDTLVWLTKERREWLADRYVSVNWDMEELLTKKDAIVQGDLLKVRLRL
ncbi:hypothetical protein PV04_03465 [Phialophora macrospora]|uniref:Ketoreductase domain-containing protein n=1 Tax=Phialophora macrospora TaxID=1851006 RepID=A0A0D2EAD4_9EURO|nr:hypothetical protein PV04_03465 [Phialophora macrospora]